MVTARGRCAGADWAHQISSPEVPMSRRARTVVLAGFAALATAGLTACGSTPSTARRTPSRPPRPRPRRTPPRPAPTAAPSGPAGRARSGPPAARPAGGSGSGGAAPAGGSGGGSGGRRLRRPAVSEPAPSAPAAEGHEPARRAAAHLPRARHPGRPVLLARHRRRDRVVGQRREGRGDRGRQPRRLRRLRQRLPGERQADAVRSAATARAPPATPTRSGPRERTTCRAPSPSRRTPTADTRGAAPAS